MSSKEKVPPADDCGRIVAAAAMNDDVCTEILLRLPAKSVTSFKLVCKGWLSLISTHHFRRLHTLRRPKPPPSLILASNNSCSFFYFNPIIDTEKPTKMIPFSINLPKNPKILSSCNGLLLLSYRNKDYKNLYVYYPTTKQSRKVSLPHNDTCIHVVELHLLFDPCVSIHYKIICVRVDRKLGMYQVEVFISESGTWNVCREPIANSRTLSIELGFELNFGSAVQCSNMIYGITYCCSNQSLYCFDIDRNALCFLPLPFTAKHEGVTYSQILQVSNGCLYFLSLKTERTPGESAALWELQLQTLLVVEVPQYTPSPSSSKWASY